MKKISSASKERTELNAVSLTVKYLYSVPEFSMVAKLWPSVVTCIIDATGKNPKKYNSILVFLSKYRARPSCGVRHCLEARHAVADKVVGALGEALPVQLEVALQDAVPSAAPAAEGDAAAPAVESNATAPAAEGDAAAPATEGDAAAPAAEGDAAAEAVSPAQVQDAVDSVLGYGLTNNVIERGFEALEKETGRTKSADLYSFLCNLYGTHGRRKNAGLSPWDIIILNSKERGGT